MAKTECSAADINRALTTAEVAPRLLSLLTYVVAGAAVALNGGWFPQQQVILLAAGSLMLALCAWAAYRGTFGLPHWALCSVVTFCGLSIAYWLKASAPFLARRDVVLIFLYAGFVFATSITQTCFTARKRMLLFLAGLALLNAGCGLAQLLLHKDFVPTLCGMMPSPVPARSDGLFLNPNHLGSYCVMALPIALIYGLRPGASVLQRRLGLACASVLTAGIAASGSRAGLISSYLMLLLSGVVLARKGCGTRAMGLTFALLMAVQAATCLANRDIFRRTADIAKTTILDTDQVQQGESQRIAYWIGSLKLWETSPVIGIGPGMLDSRWPEVQQENTQTMPYRAHNIWLQLLCEYGLAGFAPVAFALVRLLQAEAGELRRNGDDWNWPRTAATVALMGMLACETFDYSFYNPAHGIAAAILFGIALGGFKVERDSFRKTTSVSCAIFGSIVIAHCVMQQGAFYYEYKEAQAPDASTKFILRLHAIQWDKNAPHLYSAAADLALGGAREMEQSKPGSGGFRQALFLYKEAWRCDPHSLLIQSRMAECLWHYDRVAANQAMKVVESTGPHSYNVAQYAAAYYRETGQTNEWLKWAQRSAQLEKFLPHGGFKAQAH